MKCAAHQQSQQMYWSGHQHGHNHLHHQHHHHNHAVSFPSSPSSGGSNQYVVGPGQANCCAPAGSIPGSQTLPPNGQLDPAYCYNRTRTLPSGHNHLCAQYLLPSEQYTQWLYLSPRTIGLFLLSLVFILIWSSVISGVLVHHSFREHETALNTAKLFELHKDVGQFAFEIGQEMLFTLNTSMSLLDQWTSLPSNSSQISSSNQQITEPKPLPPLPEFSLESIRAKWNKTDLILEQVAANLAMKGYLDFESDVQSQVEKLRSNCVHQVSNQWQTMLASNGTISTASLFPMLVDCVQSFQQSFHTLDTLLLKDTQWLSERHSKLTMTDLVIRNMPYTLFVRGMVHRFTTLGLGMILVRSNLSHPFNVTEYFHYYYSSRQLIESSFVWNYRFLQKYLELERTDYQADMINNFFDARRVQEHDFYLKMSSIFTRIFNRETLNRIRSYIKKKNVESVERVMGNGSNAKYVQDANIISIQLSTDLFELMGLENIEQVMLNHEKMLSTMALPNLWQKYDQIVRNQIGFMSRVQDFLNISISGHMTQMSLNEQHNLLYHSVVASILFLSVLFCLSLFLGTYCCSRPPTCGGQLQTASQPQGTLSRRMRRRLWNLTSPFSMLKSCFSTPFSSATSPPRYPLLYKSSTQHQHMHYHPHNSPNTQLVTSHRNGTCPVPYCSSPNSFMMSSGKRNLCGGVTKRFPTNGVSTGISSTTGSKAALLDKYKSEKQISLPLSGPNSNKQTETASLMGDQSTMGQAHASTSRNSCHSSCCMSCPDNGCSGAADSVVVPCDIDDPNGCSKCAATGKCSSCCTFNRTDGETDCFEVQTTTTTNRTVGKVMHHKRGSSKDSKQSLSSSSLSMLSDSKNSTKSINKDSSANASESLLNHSKTTENSNEFHDD